jgi:hypothetical protein
MNHKGHTRYRPSTVIPMVPDKARRQLNQCIAMLRDRTAGVG